MRPRSPGRSIPMLDDCDVSAETRRMRSPAGATVLLSMLAILLPAGEAAAYSEHSVGTPEQIAWVRRAAHRFVAAELGTDGAGACAVLNAPLRATLGGRTCEQRWDARLARMVRERGMRARLRSELRAVASARVVVRGNSASIELPMALLRGSSRFLWTENCWMLEG
jgi:hypothetical protein